MSREREALLRLYGARVEITQSLGGMGEAVAAARAMAATRDVFLPDQFSNPANPEVHRRTTGPEIERALDGRVDVLVAGVGTGGTITGAGEYLREQATRPAHRRGRAAQLGGAVGRRDRTAPDPGHRRRVRPRGPQPQAAGRDDRASPTMTRSRRPGAAPSARGLLAGISGGAALWAALQVAARPESAGKRIVVVVPDSGERYISQAFFAPPELAIEAAHN